MEIAKIEKVIQTPNGRPNDGYKEFSNSMKERFIELTESGNEPLFNTNADDLFRLFIMNLPADARQHYVCRSCAKFVDTYGGLVAIDSNGNLNPVLWADSAPGIFGDASRAIREHIQVRAKITSIFYADEITLGTPVTKEWSHLYVQIPRVPFYGIFSTGSNSVEEKTAQSKELYKMTCNAIAEYKPENVKTAMQMVNSKAISGINVIEKQCKWFDQLLTNISKLNSTKRSNAIWLSIATTNPANCHIKSGMLGTILDDIKAGENTKAIKTKFEKKMDPLKYMRTQSKSNDGNIQAAENLFKKLGIGADALERTFATIDDLECIWKEPVKTKTTESKGIFDSLKSSNKSSTDLINWDNALDKGLMTFERFREEIMPNIEELQIRIYEYAGNNISTLLTAASKDSAPIFKYDSLDKRNQVSYYLYSGSPISIYDFRISGRNIYKVPAICYDPDVWGGKDITDGCGVHFIIDGAKDLSCHKHGNAIFPSVLRYELHEVRNTIENLSKETKIIGDVEDSVCAFRLQKEAQYDKSVAPKFCAKTSNMGLVKFQIDRWR